LIQLYHRIFSESRTDHDHDPLLVMLVLTQSDVRDLLDARTCVDAVEEAFRLQASGKTFGPGVLGTHLPGGGFHVKAAGSSGPPAYYAAKINANFPENPQRWNLPTIQGVLILFDATRGVPLAMMDSIEITALRTAAASAVAAKQLSRTTSKVLSIIGCGVQGRGHVIAMTGVRQFTRVLVQDTDPARAEALAYELSPLTGITIEPVAAARDAAHAGDVVVTCTPGREQVLDDGDLKPGSFLAAVGADNESKRELDPALLARSVVIVDSREQCASIGELHHAIAGNLMTVADVRAELSEVLSGERPGRLSDTEVIIFDSTGTALQDVAAARAVYQRALGQGRGQTITLAG